MKLYNTATRTKEDFTPKDPKRVRAYICGPTVYNYAQIGNLKTYVTEDVILRALRFLGYGTYVVMNITDIEDKIIRESKKAGESRHEFTEKFLQAFLEDVDHLGIERPDHIVRITDYIDEMRIMIQSLLDSGHAYLADGSIYYRIANFSDYGKFACLNPEHMHAGVRVHADEYEKESIGDFALWKWYEPEEDGDNVWHLEFTIDGKTVSVPGRPGWHIECSAVNEHFFESEIDIHFGGVDLVFPHHQNEIAQTEAYTGKQFARYWIHSAHLLVDGKKMSKSAGNFYTLRDLFAKLADVGERNICRAFRLMVIETRYREPFNFTFDRVRASVSTLSGFDEAVRRLGAYTPETEGVRSEFRDAVQDAMGRFVATLEDDIATPEALSVVHEFVRFLNVEIDARRLQSGEKRAVLDFLRSVDAVFGIFDFSLLDAVEIPEEILDLARRRDSARGEKDFARSDALRDEITARGYRVIDDRSGTRVEPI